MPEAFFEKTNLHRKYVSKVIKKIQANKMNYVKKRQAGGGDIWQK